MLVCSTCHLPLTMDAPVCVRCGAARPDDGWDQERWCGLVLLDRYEVERRIGAGATGAAYRARDRRAVGAPRYVLVKFLHGSQMADPWLVERFRVEALAGAMVPHPGVARTIAYAATAKLAVLVREYIPGRSLASKLRDEGPPSLAEAVEIGASIADALAASHGAGVVHRDIKPQNVYLTPDGFGGETPRILDFGFALVQLPDGQVLGATRPGLIVGTPAYMAPEQTRQGPVDGRADQYSLGVVLYRMLTGRRPLTGRTVAEQIQLNRTLAPLSARSAAPARNIPRALDAIVMRLLHKRADRRFASAVELADELRAVRLEPRRLFRPVRQAFRPAAEARRSADDVPRLSMLGLLRGFSS